jgi:hypothetical protein
MTPAQETTMSKRHSLTIDEHGRIEAAGFGGFGRYGNKALGQIIMADLGESEDGPERYRIVEVGSTIHTGGAGQANYVWAYAERA